MLPVVLQNCSPQPFHCESSEEENMRHIAHLLLASGLLLAPALALADEADDVIKYRQAVMKAIGGHMGAAGGIVKGKISQKSALKLHAGTLAALGADIPALFPAGSDFGDTPTRAQPEIWSKRDAFVKAADKAKTASAAFAKAADTPDAAARYKDLEESCKACHKDYRKKDE
jgi:cytochrome c556